MVSDTASSIEGHRCLFAFGIDDKLLLNSHGLYAPRIRPVQGCIAADIITPDALACLIKILKT